MSIKYTLPGLDGWIFTLSDSDAEILREKQSTGFTVTVATSVDEIVERIKLILRQSSLDPDESAIEAEANAARNIAWPLLFNRNARLIAPLLNAVPTTTQKVDNTALANEICAFIKARLA